jgi:hypothetical protein
MHAQRERESKKVPLYKNLPKLQHMIKTKQWNTVTTETPQEVHKGGQARWGEPLYYTASPKHHSTYLHCNGIK